MKEGIIQIEKKGENVKEKVRSRNLSNNFGVIWRLMSRISKVFFNSVPFPFYPSCSTSLCHTRHPDREPVQIEGHSIFSGRIHSTIPQFHSAHSRFFRPPRLSQSSPFLSFFPPAFYVEKERREEERTSLLSIFMRFSYTRVARLTSYMTNTHTWIVSGLSEMNKESPARKSMT